MSVAKHFLNQNRCCRHLYQVLAAASRYSRPCRCPRRLSATRASHGQIDQLAVLVLESFFHRPGSPPSHCFSELVVPRFACQERLFESCGWLWPLHAQPWNSRYGLWRAAAVVDNAGFVLRHNVPTKIEFDRHGSRFHAAGPHNYSVLVFDGYTRGAIVAPRGRRVEQFSRQRSQLSAQQHVGCQFEPRRSGFPSQFVGQSSPWFAFQHCASYRGVPGPVLL